MQEHNVSQGTCLPKEPFYRRMRLIYLKNWRLYLLLLPSLLCILIFAYGPMYGLLLSFKEYNPSLGITGSPWADPLSKFFDQFFRTSIAPQIIRNTLLLSLYTILFSFPVPILFALLVNQIRDGLVKKSIQTISFAPYFISNVVVVSIMTVILAPGSGFVNTIIKSFGGNAVLFMSRPEYFRSVYVISNIWQGMGFNAIIYIAALAGISPEYHEAAIIDGANKLQRIFFVDIPLILPTVIIMLILALGNVMTVGYEKVYLMQNGMNTTVSEVISTYVYKTGLMNAQYSFATAVGLFNSVINFILLVITNAISKKISNISVF